MEQRILSLKKELVWLDIDYSSKENLFQEVGKKLYEMGYVKDSFANALSEREKNFPTGLATEPFQVAIPHTDSIHVEKEAIACIRLLNPIKFRDVGDDENEVDAEFVFVLCILEPEKQVDILKALVDTLSNEAIMRSIKTSENPDKVYEILTQ